MKNVIFDLVRGLRDIIFPATCLGCAKKLTVAAVEGLVCPSCWAMIKRNVPPFCARCGRTVDERSRRRNICAECLKKPVHFDRAFAPCAYEGVVKELLHAFKYSGKDYLCDVLAGLMIEFIRTYRVPADSIDMLIPVPLHAARQREREFNQAELLSRRVAAALGNTKVEARNLVRTRHTRTQTELASDKRHENVAGCFRLTEPEAVAGKNIMLVDDVLTTGATLSEASRVLKEAGAGTVIALTVAN